MSSVTRPRGPLPARVYWTRRLLVLAVAFALVFGLGRVLGGASDGESTKGDTAVAAGADRSTTAASTSGPSTGATPGATPGATTKKPKKTKKPKAPPLAQPDGPCSDSEVVIRPVLDSPEGGGEVTIGLEVYSSDSEACTFRVSPSTLAVKLVSGKDFIWSTQECPKSVPDLEVVARRTVPGEVNVYWSGRRSDDDCRASTRWARPGWYHVVAAALGGEPTDVQFELLQRTADVVTQTASPTQDPKSKASDKASGAVEPNG